MYSNKKTSFLVYSDLPPEAIGTLASGVETAIDALIVRAGAQMAVFLPHIPFLGEHTPPTKKKRNKIKEKK
jgi:hypothetical protein